MDPPTLAAVFNADPEGTDRLYTTLAPVYDLLMREVFDYGEQSSLVRSAAGEDADSVLELACGTGLLLDRLADDHALAVGVDASAEMLALAADRTTAPLVRADARRLPTVRTFDGVAMLGRALTHFTTDDDLRALFDGVAAVTGGAFVLDCHDLAEMEDGYESRDAAESERYRVVRETHTDVRDAREGLCRSEATYEVTDRERGETVALEDAFAMRFFDADDLRERLRDAGFGTVDVDASGSALEVVARP